MRNRIGAVVGLFVVAVVVLPIGSIHLAYVYSGSMEPAIAENDGVILVGGGIQEGDIITFESSEREELVTHRVVDRTEAGFITQGDANPSTDQATGLSPVDKSQIVGKVLTIGGAPVVIPQIGVIATTVQNHPLRTTTGVVLAVVLISVVWERWRRYVESKPQEQMPSTAGDVYHTILVIGFVATVALFNVGASTTTVTLQVPEENTDQLDQLEGETGETIKVIPFEFSSETTQTVLTLPFVVSENNSRYVVAASGATVQNHSVNGSQLNVSLAVPPPETSGTVTTTIRVYRVPAVLPASVTTRLGRVHPLASILAGVLTVFAPFYIVIRLLLDRKRAIPPTRSRRLKTIQDYLSKP